MLALDKVFLGQEVAMLTTKDTKEFIVSFDGREVTVFR